ncbi:MAG: peptide chain release factor N(5)-glutamine methyltransferase [bacterium]
MTVREAFLWGREHLAAAGSSEAAVEAELLLRRAAGWDRAGLYTRWESPLADSSWSAYRALLDERAAGRPVHYVLGAREFMGLSFRVDERGLIPRPETEVLVETVLDFLAGPRTPDSEPRPIVVDVGTGSGCIAISVAYYAPEARVLATDISPAALELADENARRHGVAGRIRFHCGDALDPLPDELAGRVDVIASNPPYVAEALAATLPREIRDYEPPVAVVAPGDGLGMHRLLAASARRWLRPGGLLAMEVGAGQAAAICEVLQPGYGEVEVFADYGGIDRVVCGRLRSTMQGTAETGANT